MKLFGSSRSRGKRLLDRTSDPSRDKASYAPRHLGEASSLTRKQRMQVKIRKITILPWYFAAAIAVLLLALSCLVSSLFPGASSYEPDKNTDNLIRMDFVGDVALARNVMTLGESAGYGTIFDNMTGFWGEADLVFANLESAVLKEDVSAYEEAEKALHLYASYEGLASALDAGINVLGCANNHAFDYGEKACLELVDYLDSEQIVYSGIGRNQSEAASYEIIECNGLKIAFLSVTEVYYNYSAATESQGGILTTKTYSSYNYLVYQASQEADITIVYIHWGEENEVSANEVQESIGHRLIDAGADIVIGSHPHVLQEVELYKNGIIFYSLGNFIFDQGNTYARDSVMAEYTMGENGGAFRLYPVRINDGIPTVTTNWFYKARINRELSQSLSKDSYYLDEDGFITIPFDIVLSD